VGLLAGEINANPGVTVIVPTHNRAWCLEKTLQSILDQTFSDFELIVVDDGSTDGTSDLIEKYGSIRFFRNETSAGVSAARNLGLSEARGRYISFLDSDDRWLPQKLERQWHWMETHPQTQACYTDEIWIRRGVRVNPKKKHRKFSGDIFRHCLPLCIISPSSVMLRREVFDTIGVFDEALLACEDYDLWLRLAARYTVDFLEEELIIKTGGHDDQLSHKYWGMDRFRVYALEKLLRQNSLSEEQRGAVLEMLVEKCGILQTGYHNRGKRDEARYFENAVGVYQDGLADGSQEWKRECVIEKHILLPGVAE